MYGWMGKVIFVNLSDRTVEIKPLPEEIAHTFIGGRGLGARMLWDLVGAKVEPCSPDNALIFATGPLTATGFQTSGRFSLSTKSPLTNTILDSNCGGIWGARFKQTGHDVLVILGQADSPIFLEITPEGVEFKDASELWGKTVSQTINALRGKNRSILCIGPAGENLVKFASIMVDKSRALGRGGSGAVMGAKKLKAIVVFGDKKPKIYNPELFNFVRYEMTKLLRANPVTSQGLPLFGTAVLVNIINISGAFPTRNFQESQFEGAEKISGEAIAEHFLIKNAACWACPIACARVTKTSHAEGDGPEYETVWALGANCGIDDLEAITEANYLCNDMGLDTISTGGTIACAMEMAERGIIKSELRFGRADLLIPTIIDIAYRRGLGDELAEGSLRFARKYGVPELSITVKGMELPAYDPRGMQGQGLLFATSNRGACHTRGNMVGMEILGLPKLIDRFMYQGKANFVILHQNLAAVLDSLVICKFVNFAVTEEYFARALEAVTGVEYSMGDFNVIGERIWNLERLYNLFNGFTKADDTLPARLLKEPIPDGPSKGYVVHLEPMLIEYYKARGWNEEGVPTLQTLKRLGLDKLPMIQN